MMRFTSISYWSHSLVMKPFSSSIVALELRLTSLRSFSSAVFGKGGEAEEEGVTEAGTFTYILGMDMEC
jgi:hypothetical protein